MKIPSYYFQEFWVINSLMSAGTGLVLGIISTAVPVYSFLDLSRSGQFFTVFLALTLAYQITIFSFFKGKRRGAFEYSYFEKNIEQSPEIKKLIAAAKKDMNTGDHKSANSKFKKASSLAPEDFVLNFKLGVSYENIGESNEAIQSYKEALENIPEHSVPLEKYIQNQIERVESKGPTRKTAPPGLRFVIY